MTLSNLRAAIFDFDLTLVDSRLGFADSHAYAIRALGLPDDAAKIEESTALIGVPLPDAFRLLFPAHEALTDAYVQVWQARADAVMTDLTSVLPGAVDAIRSLRDAGLALGIVSQKRRYRIEAVLRREGLLSAFEVIVGGDAAGFKPDPGGLLLAMKRLGVAPEASIYAGDTVIDAETARRAGVPFVAILTGFATRADFAGYKPLALLDSVGELPAALGLDAMLEPEAAL